MSLTWVALASGRSVDLEELRMTSTYGGLLEGTPSKRMNDSILRGVVKQAEEAFPRFPVHLIEPVRKLPDMRPGFFGPVELLPVVMCVGRFTSHPVDDELDSLLYLSGLTVVWFQDTPVIPEGESADTQLQRVPWTELARDIGV